MEHTAITITLPPKKIRAIDRLARSSGFRSRNEWVKSALFYMLDVWFTESPRLSAQTVIHKMQKTKKHSPAFLKELGAAITYADTAAKS